VQIWPAGQASSEPQLSGEQTPLAHVSQDGQSLSDWHGGAQCAPASLFPGKAMHAFEPEHCSELEQGMSGITGPASPPLEPPLPPPPLELPPPLPLVAPSSSTLPSSTEASLPEASEELPDEELLSAPPDPELLPGPLLLPELLAPLPEPLLLPELLAPLPEPLGLPELPLPELESASVASGAAPTVLSARPVSVAPASATLPCDASLMLASPVASPSAPVSARDPSRAGVALPSASASSIRPMSTSPVPLHPKRAPEARSASAQARRRRGMRADLG